MSVTHYFFSYIIWLIYLIFFNIYVQVMLHINIIIVNIGIPIKELILGYINSLVVISRNIPWIRYTPKDKSDSFIIYLLIVSLL